MMDAYNVRLWLEADGKLSRKRRNKRMLTDHHDRPPLSPDGHRSGSKGAVQ